MFVIAMHASYRHIDISIHINLSVSTTKTFMIDADVAIIGGGVVGIAMAWRLVLNCPTVRVALVEALPAVLCGASSGNSAMIHSGFDCTPGSTEHRMVKRGHELFATFAAGCQRRGIYLPWSPTGALMLAMTQDELHTMNSEVAPTAAKNGVEVRSLSTEDVLSLEPHVSHNVLGGLLVPGEWIVDPWHYPAVLLAEGCATNRLTVVTKCKLVNIEKSSRTAYPIVLLDQAGPRVACRAVVNCAGLHADTVETLCGPLSSKGQLDFTLFPRLGRFVQFDIAATPLVRRALLPIPTTKTKGIIVFTTVFGNVIVGPTAEDPDEPRLPQAEVVKRLRAAAVSKVPALDQVASVGAYAGARPALRGRQDYFIDYDSRGIGWFTIAGVRSTGLTSSIALAEDMTPSILKYINQARSPIGEVPTSEVIASLRRVVQHHAPLNRRHPISLDGNPQPKL